jgi:hypothetical protein
MVLLVLADSTLCLTHLGLFQVVEAVTVPPLGVMEAAVADMATLAAVGFWVEGLVDKTTGVPVDWAAAAAAHQTTLTPPHLAGMVW